MGRGVGSREDFPLDQRDKNEGELANGEDIYLFRATNSATLLSSDMADLMDIIRLDILGVLYG